MSQPIDFTYVELRARGEDDAARNVKRAVDDMERDVDRASREMESDLSTAFKDAADNIERELERSNSSLSKVAVAQRKALRSLGDDASDVFDEISDVIDHATDAVGGGGGGGGGGGLLGAVAQLGSQFKNLGGFTPPPILFALAAATPAIIGLVAALADLSALALLLPGAIGILAASVITLTTAFSGVGDAVKALASGDLAKIEEAMKKLAPAAQAFAREINALREPFAALKRQVQQAFFAPLLGDLTRLANSVLPTLRKGMSSVAASFGELGSSIFALLGSTSVVDTIGEVFASTARIVRNIAPEITAFLGTLFDVIKASLPFIERAFGALGSGLQAASDFLGGAIDSGAFNDFLEDAFATLKDLADLTGALFELFKALFGSADDEGRSFIQTLTQMIERFTEFIKSAEGQEILQRTIDTLTAMGVVLGVLVEAIILYLRFQNLLFKGLELIGAGAVTAVTAIGKFFQTLWNWTKDAAGAVGDFFEAVGGFFADIGGWIADAFNKVVEFGGKIITWITELPGKIVDGIKALPETLAAFFTDALNRVAFVIGFGIGTVVQFFLDLPGRIGTALLTFLTTVQTTFVTLRDQAIARALELVNAVVQFFTELPERVVNAVTSIIDRVREIFTSVRDSAASRIRDMANSVVAFFVGLPGRVSKAVTDFKNRVIQIFTDIKNSAFNIGRDIINGIKNGITDAIGGAVDLAKDAARQIVDGFKSALKSGSPSRLTADEIGVPIMQGIGVGMQREAPTVREEIEKITGQFAQQVPGVPANATGAATGIGAGAGTVITFDAGAVQVVFEGVVPTEQEAARTGNAVGQGIAQTLARRNVRTLVRTT